VRRALIVCSILGLIGCGGSQRSGTIQTSPLGQARAVELLQDVMTQDDRGPVETNLEARLTNGTVVNVDVFIRTLGAGFVFLNEQDRLNLEGEIPAAADASQLYALLAQLLPGEEQIHVLIIQDNDFEYIPNPRANEREPEHRTIDDVEARLRRDARDFLHAIIDLHGGSPEP
jgi:hypothetical protein